MDSINTNDKTSPLSEENKNESSSALQINPLTLMTSISPYNPVDDSQENILESTCVNPSQSQSNDFAVSSEKSNQRNIQKPVSIIHMDEHSVAAWVQSTTMESITSPIERSPSLPATIIEQISIRSRRDSNVSTLCDQQQQQQVSTLSDTISSNMSQNLATPSDIQRSFSFPLVDQHQYNDNNQNIQLIQEENDEDFASRI
jgi:hypothetical protein